MKLVIAATALVLCVSPASARCGLLTWVHDDTCAGPFQPKSPQEILANDMAWCKAHSPGQINACLDALTKRRNADATAQAIRERAIIQSIPDNPFPRQRSCVTSGGGVATGGIYTGNSYTTCD